MNNICPLASKYVCLEEIVTDMTGWNCPMEFNLSPTADEEPKYIDLCTILKGKESYQLPKHFHGMESKKRIISAMKCGFALVHRSSQSVKQLDKHMSAYLILQRQHGLTYTDK